MAAERHPLSRYVRQLAAHLAAELPDRLLLERFVCRREEAAFAALVRRHGPLVWAVCWRVLHHEQDAEDAFQATFLVLARKAGSLKRPEALGPWLHGVATRTALKARARAARRRAGEGQAAVAPEVGHRDEPVWRDLRPLLDEAVGGLPEKYRVPFVLCYLEGKTVTEAAEQLGCPRGTVATRLAWARDRLRARLAGRGLALPAAVLTAALARRAAPAGVPAALAWTTAEAAAGAAVGRLATGAASIQAATLAKGVVKTMFLTKGKIAVAVFLAASAVGVGLGVSRPGVPRLPTSSQAPVSERFYAGGFRSLRGFAFRGVGPDSDGGTGGDFQFLNSLEYQVPIKASDQFFLVGFLDSGTVEQRTGSLLFGVGVNSDAGLTGSIVLNERNFDVRRPPTCLDDLPGGKRFRGAGEEFRLEAAPGPCTTRRPG
jgi:RNA polymerase sigma factor (sigma-70 family)